MSVLSSIRWDLVGLEMPGKPLVNRVQRGVVPEG